MNEKTGHERTLTMPTNTDETVSESGLDAYVLKQLHRIRNVQRRIELLKPLLDEAVDGVQKLYLALERSVKDEAEAAKNNRQGSKRVSRRQSND